MTLSHSLILVEAGAFCSFVYRLSFDPDFQWCCLVSQGSPVALLYTVPVYVDSSLSLRHGVHFHLFVVAPPTPLSIRSLCTMFNLSSQISFFFFFCGGGGVGGPGLLFKFHQFNSSRSLLTFISALGCI